MIYNFKERIKNGLFILSVLQLLGKAGFALTPFYIHREFFKINLKPSVDPAIKALNFTFLQPAEVAPLKDYPEIRNNQGLIQNRWLEKGCKCFAAKKGQDIAAFMWCSLDRFIGDYVDYKLETDEAYLFGAFTFKEYRGHNLAPFLRYSLYQQLYAEGRTKFYSITEYFNTPAVNFKKKLGAKPVKIILHVCLFKKYHRNITIRNYK